MPNHLHGIIHIVENDDVGANGNGGVYHVVGAYGNTAPTKPKYDHTTW